MNRLIECVPNFSEGRDSAKVDAIVQAMSSVPRRLRPRSRNGRRSQSLRHTLAGDPDAVGEASILGAGKALELIDMTEHKGAHPRVGATDVIPFIPIEGVTLEDCVALARRVGNEIWKRYRIPFFSTKPRPPAPIASIWKTCAVANSRDCAKIEENSRAPARCRRTKTDQHRGRHRSWARANSWSLTTSISTPRILPSPTKLPRPSASPAVDFAT